LQAKVGNPARVTRTVGASQYSIHAPPDKTARVREGRRMAETTRPALEMLHEVVDAWLRRNERRAATEAGSLTFWRDGMLRLLQQIADGEATPATFQALADEFRESDAPVTRSMDKLKELRDKLGGGRISEQIDIVLNDYRFGKNIIRDKISYIIFDRKKDTDITETARSICADIATLNAEIARLERMVSLR